MSVVAPRDAIDAREHLATAALCAVLALRRPSWPGAPPLWPAGAAAVGTALRQVVQAYRAMPAGHRAREVRRPSALLSSPALTNEDRATLAAAGASGELLAHVERRLAELEAARQPMTHYGHARLLDELFLRITAAAELAESSRPERTFLVAARQLLVDLGLTVRAPKPRPRRWQATTRPRRRGHRR